MSGCKHITKNGSNCRQFIRPDHEYCYQHSKDRAINQQSSKAGLAPHRFTNILSKEMITQINDGYSGLSLQEMADYYAPRVFASLCDMAINGKSEDTKIRASAIVLDRILGKMAQPLTLDRDTAKQLGILVLPTITAGTEIIDLDSEGNPIEKPIIINIKSNKDQ